MNAQGSRSLKGFAWQIKVPLATLQRVTKNIAVHYSPFRKPGKKVRLIHNPSKELKRIQRRIYVTFLQKYPLPDSVFGAVKGRSALDNAKLHLGQATLLHVDIMNFFPSVGPTRVYQALRKHLKLSPPVARLICKLTTYDGQLPHGAPSSAALANLVLLDLDAEVAALAKKEHLRDSRYVDDITLSGVNVRRVVPAILALVADAGFTVSRRKLRVGSRSTGAAVTGFNVDRLDGPFVSRAYRDRVKAAIKQLDRQDSDFQDATQRIQGRIAYIKQTDSLFATRLQRALNQKVRLRKRL